MRRDATTRRPASSSILVIAPVRLRRVASGLMIEKVRVTAMTGRSPVFELVGIGAAPSEGPALGQASALLGPLPALLSPVASVDPLPSRQQLPGKPGAFEGRVVEQIEGAVVG